MQQREEYNMRSRYRSLTEERIGEEKKIDPEDLYHEFVKARRLHDVCGEALLGPPEVVPEMDLRAIFNEQRTRHDKHRFVGSSDVYPATGAESVGWRSRKGLKALCREAKKRHNSNIEE